MLPGGSVCRAVAQVLFLACFTLAVSVATVKEDKQKLPLVRRAEHSKSDEALPPETLAETEDEFMEPEIEMNESQRAAGLLLEAQQAKAAGLQSSTSLEYRRRRVLRAGMIVVFHNHIHQRYIRANGATCDASATVTDMNHLPDSWTNERWTVIEASRRRGAIAFHNPVWNRFMAMSGTSMVMSNQCEDYQLPWDWNAERYLEQEVGGYVALWNPHFQRFVRMRGHWMDSSPVQAMETIPLSWTWEQYSVLEENVDAIMQPGDIVAFHNGIHNRFIRMNGAAIDASGVMAWNTLPDGWTWERFTVVDAGNGEIALHNKIHNRFLKFGSHSSPPCNLNELPAGWLGERFSIVNAGKGQASLWNSWCNCYVRMNNDKVDSSGAMGAEALPDGWTWERFRVVKVGTEPLILAAMQEKKVRDSKDTNGADGKVSS